jgi:hypothetical protein
MLTLSAPQAETLWDGLLPVEVHELPGLIVPAGSVDACCRRNAGTRMLDARQRQRCSERCRTNLEQRSADRAAQAMVEGCSLAGEHRRERRTSRRGDGRARRPIRQRSKTTLGS